MKLSSRAFPHESSSPYHSNFYRTPTSTHIYVLCFRDDFSELSDFSFVRNFKPVAVLRVFHYFLLVVERDFTFRIVLYSSQISNYLLGQFYPTFLLGLCCQRVAPFGNMYLIFLQESIYHSGTFFARISASISSVKPLPLRTDSIILKANDGSRS